MQFLSEKPHADISIRNNRVKKYAGKSVYLNDNTEFQIELDNPTSDIYLAKIYINNVELNSGIVLNPGRHVFLDCDPTTRHKFVFNTYTVSGNRSKVIKHNGNVRVTFHRKQLTSRYDVVVNPLVDTKQFVNRPDKTYPRWMPKYLLGMPEMKSDTTMRNVNRCSSISAKDNNDQIETGRIEMGDTSSQQFSESREQFNTYSSYSNEYKLLPISNKPSEIPIVRAYCSNCGKKARAKDNYCSQCGSQV